MPVNPPIVKDSSRMQVQIEGEINGKPFSVIRAFSHADLDRGAAAVSGSPRYLERLNGVLARCADEIVKAGL